ncbi:MAG: alpha-L-rhamnosidase N-terminal domain-containing protein [Clostridiales bacterium]|nr:alpha-L-rhamnosidase N-terminal domain-containing protein [Clostridiales bacterium]
MKITGCKTNHMVNPLGFDMTKPLISYVIKEAEGKTQALLRISENEDMSDPIFETHLTHESNKVNFGAPIGVKPRTRYYWNALGEAYVSETNWFETAKMDEPWQAKWISSYYSGAQYPIFSKQIEFSDVKSARLYICGLGQYEAYIGKEKVTEDFLPPYRNGSIKELQYQTCDVTEAVKNGESLEVWFGSGAIGGFANEKPSYGITWKLIAELHVTHTDGSEDVVGTDGSWKVAMRKAGDAAVDAGEHPNDAPVNAALCKEALPPLKARLLQ